MVRYENQVLIVGGGPVGLTLAFRLETFGIPCVLFEAEATPPEDLRASTFHPPTLDMLDEYDLAQPLIDQGLKAPHWQIRIHETGEQARFDLSVLKNDTAHPYRLQCEQFRLCRLLEARLQGAAHADLRPGWRVEAVEQDEDGVRVRGVDAQGQPFEETGRFLVGADGARSVVRKAMDLSFEGKTYPETTVLATTTHRFEDQLQGLSNVNYVWREGGTFSLLRLRDKWRCSLYPDEGETIEQVMEPERIERKLQAIAPKDGPYEIIDLRPYRVHMRIVEDYRTGRFVLAGDAAHVNSPSGGMGMNGGVHDAFNLSATLKEIWEGASLDLLDRYTRQRRPIAAEEILVQADGNRARMQERDWDKRRAMFAELQKVAADPQLSYERLLKSSMIVGLRRAAEIA
jgi:3-(3-hydroxy-phenyl)propionate hydroxylase